MTAYWSDLIVIGLALFGIGVAIYKHDSKPRNRYRRNRKDVLPPPSPACRRDYA